MTAPTEDAARAALIETLKRWAQWWSEWSAKHPGLADPFSDVMGQVFAGVAEDRIAAAMLAAPKEFLDFIRNKEGPITPGGDPSSLA